MFAPTPLVPTPRLTARLGADRIWAKVERANPTGTHKDRAADAMVAVSGGAITVGTCGSAGLAIALASRLAGVRATVFVPDRYRTAPLEALVAFGATVVRTPGAYEDAVAASAAFAARTGAYDANPTGAGGTVSLTAYEAIAAEILAELGQAPDCVWVPAGNGTTLAGVARGFLRAGGKVPRVCGAGSAGNTAVVESIRQGRVIELDPRGLVESAANEPLLNWRSAHAREALDAVRETGGLACGVSDPELHAAVALLREDGLQATPAGAAGLAALQASGSGRGTHVLLLTA